MVVLCHTANLLRDGLMSTTKSVNLALKVPDFNLVEHLWDALDKLD